MSVPLFKDKLDGNVITGPQNWMKYMKDQGRFAQFQVPDIFVFTWQKTFFKWAKSRYAHNSCPGFIGDVILLDGRRSHEKLPKDQEFSPRVGMAGNFGVGSPSAVLLMESLISLGVKTFVGIGTAGGLQSGLEGDLKVGDTILADLALRDEGTSYHYLPADTPARPSEELFNRIKKQLEGEGIIPKVGAVWTTDAVFRETAEEVLHFVDQGALAVDMEAAALFACAKKRGVSMASLFALSDILTPQGWTPDFHHKNINKTLGDLLEVVGGLKSF